jgi:hypothetical protein
LRTNEMILILLLLMMAIPCISSDSLDNATTLDQLGLSMLPSSEETNQQTFDDSLISFRPIWSEDINSDFTNIDDLSWLEEPASENNCILIGESHYYRYIENIKNRILFALNTFDEYPYVILELPYSLTPYINYYLEIESDSSAEQYLDNELESMLDCEERIVFLRHIRQWNGYYPDKEITVGCSDIEHNYRNTLSRIVLPYLQQIDSSFELDPQRITAIELQDMLPEMRFILEHARENNTVGAYPFINASYIENVIENLESACIEENYGHLSYYYRQQAIIRNLTSPQFLREFFENGKVLIMAGIMHTRSIEPYPLQANFFSEGAYLNFDYEYTRGRTYSIGILGYAYSLNSMAGVNLDSCTYQGSMYRSTVSTLQSAYQSGLIQPDDRVLTRPLDDLDLLFLQCSSVRMNVPILLNSINNEAIKQIAMHTDRSIIKNVSAMIDWFTGNHDRCIIVPWSPIVTALCDE